MKKKFTMLCAVVLATTVVLSACGKSADDGAKKPDDKPAVSDDKAGADSDSKPDGTAIVVEDAKDVLRLTIGSEPPAFHPMQGTDTTSSGIKLQLFEGLLTYDANGNVAPGQAESYEVSEDGLDYTFKLREGLVWSNGDPITANDFADSIRWGIDPSNMVEYAEDMLLFIKNGHTIFENDGEGIDTLGVEVIDDLTLKITLENPTPFFDEVVTFPTYLPFNHANAEGNDEWFLDAKTYVSNGPFVMSVLKPTEHIVLTKNENYWDKDNVKLSTIDIRVIENADTVYKMFENDELDYIMPPYNVLPTDVARKLLKDNDPEFKVVDQMGVYFLRMNTISDEQPLLQDVDFRKALAYSINRRDIIDNVATGTQKPSLRYTPEAVKGGETFKDQFKDADIELAKEHLQKALDRAGISDPSEVVVNYLYNTSEGHAKIAQAIQDIWVKDLGIQVNLANQEWKVYLETQQALDYDVSRSGWIADYNDAHTFLGMFATADNPNNNTGWEDPEYQQLIKDSVTEQDPAKRFAILAKADAILMDAMPVLPIYQYTIASVMKPNVEGVVTTATSTTYFKYTYKK